MSDHSPQLWNIFVEILRIGLITVIGWITWAFRKHSTRLSNLEHQSIKRDEYNGTIESLRNDVKDSARETHRRLDKLYLHMSESKDKRNG